MNFRLLSFILILVFFVSSCSSGSSGSSGSNSSEQQNNRIINDYKILIGNKEYERAYNKLLVLENESDTRNYAKNEIGFFYENGLFVEKNINLALKYYGEAGNNNYIPAVFNVGRVRLEQGNYAEAASIFKSVEKNNYAPALNLLGIMYNYGYSYDVNFQMALAYYKKAAALGNPDAQFNIGQMYFQGEGVNKNFEEAFKWYTLSANQNYSLAKIQLATLYFKGYGVDVNINKAIDIIKPLAEDGNPDAIYNIRLYYKNVNDLKKYEYWDQLCKKTYGCDI